MMYKHTTIKIVLLIFILAVINIGCDKTEQAATIPSLMPLTAADECHVCGMRITHFPGPKGQAFIKHQQQSLKFCSTVDLFSWTLQPDTTALLQTAYVHDMGAAAASWKTPSEAHYVDAKQAWYVAGHNQMGAMGPTIASFKQRHAAVSFIKQHGGNLLRYEQVDLTVLSNLSGSHSHKH